MTGPVDGTVWFLVYYDSGAPGATPVGVARKVPGAGGATRAESLGRDGDWHPTELFKLQWLGRDDKDLVEVPQAQAEQWVEQFRDRLRSRDEKP